MPRVFLPEPLQRLDPSNAETFGDLRCLSSVSFNPFDMNAAYEFINENLDRVDFDPDEDYIAMSGGVVIQSLTLTAILVRYQRVKLLMWNTTSKKYFEKSLSLPYDRVIQKGNLKDV